MGIPKAALEETPEGGPEEQEGPHPGRHRRVGEVQAIRFTVAAVAVVVMSSVLLACEA